VLLIAGIFALMRPNTNNTTSTATATTAPPSPTARPTSKPTVDSNATATAISSQNPYPPHTGTLILNDPLRDNSKGYKWDEASYAGGDSCGFSGGAYHIIEKSGLICIPEASQLNLNNFAFEADITIAQGDNGGIAFRIDQVNKTFYSFDIGTSGGYVLSVYNGKYTTLSQGTNSVIKQGLNQTNRVAVVANGNLITIYVNNQILDSVHDSAYNHGQIGVAAFTAINKAETNVIVSNVRVWKL